MMSKLFKILIGLLLVGLIAGLAIYFFVYNKPHVNYEKAKPEMSISGETLYMDYLQDEESANQTYTGKVVQIDGVLYGTETAGELTIAMFSFGEGMFGPEGVRCTMLENHAAAINEVGDGTPLTIKGYVTGFNGTDVIMENCSIVD